jgi:hypothetical protein
MMLMGALCWLTALIWRSDDGAEEQATQTTQVSERIPTVALWHSTGIAVALAAAIVVALLTPVLWTTGKLRSLPWPIESYINGVHTFGRPQAWLFPIFPWVGFSFVGLAIGFFLLSDFAKRKESSAFIILGGAGVVACVLSLLFDAGPIRLYDPIMYDYWHSSPSFFLMRCGVLLVILFLTYAWCRWGLAQRGFSPMIQLGLTSLLVYWVHIEFVYGRLSILPKGRSSIADATAGLAIIFVAMLALSIGRTRWKRKRRTTKVSQASPAVAATAESV